MNQYDLAYLLAAPFFLSNAYYKRWKYGKYKESLPGMFGANYPEKPLKPCEHRVWLHSVSVGESVAASAVYREISSRFSDWEFLATTGTETGQAHARKVMKGVQHFDYIPVDFSWQVRKFLEAYNPSLYLFFETEIWPNILLQNKVHKIPSFLVNGKLSEKSSRGYSYARPLLKKPLNSLKAILAQTDQDAERFESLCGKKTKIYVTGNVKFDGLPDPLRLEDRKSIRDEYQVKEDEILVVAGSTHPGEEKIILEAFNKAQKYVEKLRLLIAPRHPERFDEVDKYLREMKQPVVRLSRAEFTEDKPVLLLDQMGVLAKIFGAADIALVGGAWAPIGGHNLLEPAIHGVPVVHGPQMHAQKEIMRIMNNAKGSLEVDGHMLDEVFVKFAKSEEARKDLGSIGQKAALSNRGAAKRTVDYILKSLNIQF